MNKCWKDGDLTGRCCLRMGIKRSDWSRDLNEGVNHGSICKRVLGRGNSKDKNELVCLKENRSVQLQQKEKREEWQIGLRPDPGLRKGFESEV